MNKIVLFAVLSLCLQAHANGIIDAWQITAGTSAQSVATKADGSQVIVNGEFAVTLNMENDRYSQPSIRQVMAKVVGNEIRLTVESTEQSICGLQSSDGFLIDLGHDSARTTVITGLGEYNVVINGFVVGSMTVDGTKALQIKKNADYFNQINAELNRRLAAITGDLSRFTSSEKNKSISVAVDQNGNFEVDYLIAAHDEPQSNGDILHKAERKGHALVEYLDINLGCETGETGKAQSWRISIRDKSQENTLLISKSGNSREVSFQATRQGETLNFQLAEKK